MASKKELQAIADQIGVKYTSKTTGEELQKLIDEANGDAQAPEFDGKEDGKFNSELVATLQEHPHILNVWVNENGDWHFRDTPGFTSYSREEILNG